MSGFVVIHRSLLGHPDFRNDAEAMAFAWMVMRASWKPVRVRYKGKAVSLERGQLCVSQRDMAAALDRDKGWVERLWRRLQTQGAIEVGRGAAAMIITICNYAKYQDKKDKGEAVDEAEDEADARQTQGIEQRREQFNKEQVIIEPNGSMPRRSSPKVAKSLPDDWEPILTPDAQAKVSGWSKEEFERQLTAFKDHAADKGRTSKDWQAAFRTWIGKANEWRMKNGSGNNSGQRSRGAPPEHNPLVRAVLADREARAASERFGQSGGGAEDGVGSW